MQLWILYQLTFSGLFTLKRCKGQRPGFCMFLRDLIRLGSSSLWCSINYNGNLLLSSSIPGAKLWRGKTYFLQAQSKNKISNDHWFKILYKRAIITHLKIYNKIISL